MVGSDVRPGTALAPSVSLGRVLRQRDLGEHGLWEVGGSGAGAGEPLVLKDVAGICGVSGKCFPLVRSMNGTQMGFKREPWRPPCMAQASPVVTDPPEPPVRPEVPLATSSGGARRSQGLSLPCPCPPDVQ